MNSTAYKNAEYEAEIIQEGEHRYDPSQKGQYLDEFHRLAGEGKLNGKFDDNTWETYNGVRHRRIVFDLDEPLYQRHMWKELHIPAKEVLEILKCYILTISWNYTFRILIEKTRSITGFLQSVPVQAGGPILLTKPEKNAIEGFLEFLSLDKKRIRLLMKHVRIKEKSSAQRDLAPISTYIALAEEVAKMFEESPEMPEKECFIRFFPVYLWVRVTFIIPLRATEFLLTPFDCIREEGGKAYLILRRTLLKNSSLTVFHEVEKDYKECSYLIPRSRLIGMVQRYKELTGSTNRKTLLVHGTGQDNAMLSLEEFNSLLARFTRERLAGNPRYEFYQYAMNIDEFDTGVTAGDSRHIAASNLLFQDIGMDIIRQLMGHERLNTSFHYCSNITETILASAVIMVQREINASQERREDSVAVWLAKREHRGKPGCSSLDSPKETGRIDDCIAHQHLESCFGCPFYTPDDDELAEELKNRKEQLEASARILASRIEGITGMKNLSNEDDVAILAAQTSAARFRQASEELAERKFNLWQRHHYSQKSC